MALSRVAYPFARFWRRVGSRSCGPLARFGGSSVSCQAENVRRKITLSLSSIYGLVSRRDFGAICYAGYGRPQGRHCPCFRPPEAGAIAFLGLKPYLSICGSRFYVQVLSHQRSCGWPRSPILYFQYFAKIGGGGGAAPVQVQVQTGHIPDRTVRKFTRMASPLENVECSSVPRAISLRSRSSARLRQPRS